MNVRVTGKQMDIGDAFRTRITGAINDGVTKYFDGGFSSQVTVTKNGSRFNADCRVHLDSGADLHAAGDANDPQVLSIRRWKRSKSACAATSAGCATITSAQTRACIWKWPIR